MANRRALDLRSARRAMGRSARRAEHIRRARRDRRAIRSAPASLPAPIANVAPVADATGTLETLLLENVLPFWYPTCIDPSGGFTIGDPRADAPPGKLSIAQARQAWFFARIGGSAYGLPEHLDAARHGVEYLWTRALDEQNGGFYWRIDDTGRPFLPWDTSDVAARGKSLLVQAYVLYATAELALATGDPAVTARARELFDLIESRARDARTGSFVEILREDWSAVPPGALSLHRGTAANHRTFGTQCHLLEAFTPHVRLTDDPHARAALAGLRTFIDEHMVLRPVGIASSVNDADGTPVLGHREMLHNYGHDLELAWLLTDADRALDSTSTGLTTTAADLFANAIHAGEDPQGGLFDAGPIGGSPERTDKLWWVQAEALVSALTLHAASGDDSYAAAFHRVLRWIVDHQADWTNGEWHAVVRPDGTKARGDHDGWRTAYHEGRALLECLEVLRAC